MSVGVAGANDAPVVAAFIKFAFIVFVSSVDSLFERFDEDFSVERSSVALRFDFPVVDAVESLNAGFRKFFLFLN